MTLKDLMTSEGVTIEMPGQPEAVAKVMICASFPRTSTVLFGLEREDRPGSVEDVVDLITKFDASLNTIHTSRQDSTGQVHIYGNVDIETGKISTFRDQLGGFNEMLYFKSIE